MVERKKQAPVAQFIFSEMTHLRGTVKFQPNGEMWGGGSPDDLVGPAFSLFDVKEIWTWRKNNLAETHATWVYDIYIYKWTNR